MIQYDRDFAGTKSLQKLAKVLDHEDRIWHPHKTTGPITGPALLIPFSIALRLQIFKRLRNHQILANLPTQQMLLYNPLQLLHRH